MKGFAGVFLREAIGEARGLCGVINLDDSDEKGNAERGGTHWTCWYKNTYFDSLGSAPPEELLRAVDIKKYSSTVHQNPLDVSCGYWCIKFLREMQNSGGNFERVMGEMAEVDKSALLREISS